MTGGQMAPTTLVGQSSATSPYGRDPHFAGYPIHMCEMLATLKAPRYIERTSLNNVANLTRTKRAIKKALDLQSQGRGVHLRRGAVALPDATGASDPSEVDRLARGEPDARVPARRLPRREDGGGEAMTYEIVLAGFGGQGILFLGKMIAVAGMVEGKEVSWIPSYGPEMRGGTANCSVVVSDRQIGMPVVSQPNVLVVDEPAVAREVRVEGEAGRFRADQQDADRDPAHADGHRRGLPGGHRAGRPASATRGSPTSSRSAASSRMCRSSARPRPSRRCRWSSRGRRRRCCS